MRSCVRGWRNELAALGHPGRLGALVLVARMIGRPIADPFLSPLLRGQPARMGVFRRLVYAGDSSSPPEPGVRARRLAYLRLWAAWMGWR